MNKKYERALKNAGIDTDRYFSLRIDKQDIPDGAEIVVQVRDINTGELRKIPMKEAVEKCFAENSRFYKQTMADGHIFNPYIHRRFLPSQYRRNMLIAGFNGIDEYVQERYGWNYITRFLREECAKLAMLERRDREAFNERSRFFALDDMKAILLAYVSAVHSVLDEAARTPVKCREPYCDIKGIGCMKLVNIRPMKYRFQQFADAVSACHNYSRLSDVLNRFEFCKLDNALHGDRRFTQCFLASGAFYTLKHMIMFEGLSLGGANVVENLKMLNAHHVYEFQRLYCRYAH